MLSARKLYEAIVILPPLRVTALSISKPSSGKEASDTITCRPSVPSLSTHHFDRSTSPAPRATATKSPVPVAESSGA